MTQAKIRWVIAFALLLCTALATPALAQSISRFGHVVATVLTVNSTTTLTGDVTMGDDLTVTDLVTAADVTATDDVSVGDDLTVTDDASITDDATFGGDLILTAATSITVTNGAAFTPTGFIQPITAGGAVTPTITIPSAGKCYAVRNTSSNTITIVDTGNQVLAGNFAMGQYDVLGFCSDGTRIIEHYRSNN